MELLRQKNVATHITFPLLNTSGIPATGAGGLDSEIDVFSDGSNPDGFTDCTNEATEIGSSGIYYLSLTQAEMNNDYLYITTKSSDTNVLNQHVLVRTMTGDPLLVATSLDVENHINSISGIINDISTDTTLIVEDTNEIQGKLPTNYMMGSSDQTDKDDEIDEINLYVKAISGIVPQNSVWTNTRAGYLDNLNNLATASELRQEIDDNSTQLSGIIEDTDEIQGKLPTNYIMGSSDQTDKDDEIDNINTHVESISGIAVNIQGRLPSSLISGRMNSDMTAISGDSTASDNLEANFDGTGYVDDTAPATQAQLSKIANVGSAINKQADSYTLTTGTQSANTYADTASLNGTRHTHTDDGGEIDLYYEFGIGGGTPSSVKVTGKLTSGNDDLEVYGYDWATTSWIQIGILEGRNNSANAVYDYDLFATMVGTGANLGIVRIRFTDGAYTLTSATFYVDQIFVSYSQGSGDYALGRIWIDTNASNTNTVPGVDGISTNPVSTWASALTLSASLNIKDIHIINGSDITLSSNTDNYSLFGDNWTLGLNSQSIDGANFVGARVSGIAEATTAQPTFALCHMGEVTIPPCHLTQCGIGDDSGTFNGASAGQYIMHHCYSLVPGAGTPTLDFSGLGDTVGINNRGWLGGSNYTLDQDCTISHEVVAGGGQTFTTGGADVELRGTCRSVNFVMSGAETLQFVGVTGSIDVSGTTSGVVNLYGVSSSLTDTSVTATITDETVSATDTNAILVDTNEIQGKLPTNYIMGSSVQTDKDDEIDSIKTSVEYTSGVVGALNDISASDVKTQADTALSDILLDKLISSADSDDVVDNSVIAKLASTSGDWSTFVSATEALQSIRDRGDGYWTGSGSGVASLTQILNVHPLIPNSIDLANTATVRLGLGLTNAVDDLPSTAEITPGTISIDRKAIGGTSWNSVVSDSACSEVAGLIYYDEVFDSGTGYAENDSVRITFKNQNITVEGDVLQVTDSDGWTHQTYIRASSTGSDEFTTNTLLTISGVVTSDVQNRYTIIPVPHPITSVDIDSTAVQLGFSLRTNRGSLPTIAEIDPGTYSIYRKRYGQGSWILVANGACNATDGNVSTLEQFTTSSGYSEGDTIQAIFADCVVTIDGVNYDIAGSSGIRQTFEIREKEVTSYLTSISGIVTDTLEDTAEMQPKLPTNYIMGSSVQSDKDDEIDNINTHVESISGIVSSDVQNRYNVFSTPTLSNTIDLSDNSIRFGVSLHTNRGALPDTAEITPGIHYVYRQGVGESSWTNIVNGVSSNESDGEIYGIEVFNSSGGYVVGDIIYVYMTNQSVIINSKTYNLPAVRMYAEIREVMRGTDDASTSAELNAVSGIVDNIYTDTTLIVEDTNEIQGKLPTNYMMGSSVQTDKDDKIDNINTHVESISGIVSSDVQNRYNINIHDITPRDIGLSEGVIRVGINLTTNRGALPSIAEITAGTIYISRRRPNDSGWTNIVSNQSCTIQDGSIYFLEAFNTSSGYQESDVIYVQMIGQAVTIDGVSYEIGGHGGGSHYVQFAQIIDPMRGTDNASTSAELNAVSGIVDNIYTDTTQLTTDLTTARASYLDNLNIGEDVAGVSDVSGMNLSYSGIADAVWDEPIAGHTDTSQFGGEVQLHTQVADIDTALINAIVTYGLDHIVSTSVTGTDVADNSIIAKMVSKSATADFDSYNNTTDALEAISDTQGGGGSLTDILNVQALIPYSVDLADTATVKIGLGLTNMLGDLPSPTEITPGTITIDRKGIGGTAWTNIVDSGACSEVSGVVYYNEVFDSATGYGAGDSIRIIFKNQKITVDATDYEITGNDGWTFQTNIREKINKPIAKFSE